MDEDIKIRKNNIWIILLYAFCILILLVIIGFVIFRMALNTKKENNEEMHKISTSRRTTTSSLTEPTTEIITEEVTTTTTRVTTTSTTTTQTTTTTKKTTTTAANVDDDDEEEIVTTKVVKPTEYVNPENVRTPTTGASTHPAALNDWEWKIFELINNERSSKGLNKVVMASELRNKAERSIDQSISIKEFNNSLSDYSNYHTIISNIRNEKDLFNYMISDKYGSIVITDPYITYVGIGIITKIGPDGIPAYYYAVIFE